MYDELSIKRLRKINGSFGGDVTERIPFYDLLLSYYIRLFSAYANWADSIVSRKVKYH